ncbi:hypothetical protein N0543_17770, partial [Pseudomonas aeruginosa]|nr:hypothetical protein [Pseudomonas aeruginosa]
SIASSVELLNEKILLLNPRVFRGHYHPNRTRPTLRYNQRIDEATPMPTSFRNERLPVGSA